MGHPGASQIGGGGDALNECSIRSSDLGSEDLVWSLEELVNCSARNTPDSAAGMIKRMRCGPGGASSSAQRRRDRAEQRRAGGRQSCARHGRQRAGISSASPGVWSSVSPGSLLPRQAAVSGSEADLFLQSARRLRRSRAAEL